MASGMTSTARQCTSASTKKCPLASVVTSVERTISRGVLPGVATRSVSACTVAPGMGRPVRASTSWLMP